MEKAMPEKDQGLAFTSVLDYYQQNQLNPVPIALEDAAAWQTHFQKRQNLYQRHLGIPFSLLRGRSIIEFGCNSGENSLVLAAIGADLTLVEPNEQVLERLHRLFKRFRLEDQIVELKQEGIGKFESRTPYDVVIAEGFLYTLPNRDDMIRKMVGLIAPGGLAIITFNDRFGGFLELTRQMLLRRACELSGINDMSSTASLDMAKQLYYQDFLGLNASRPFEAWWEDALVNPCVTAVDALWSYQELIPLVEQAGCEFYGSSPTWDSSDHFGWYKNVPDRAERHARLLNDWAQVFPYFLTGVPLTNRSVPAASSEVIEAVADLVSWLSAYTLSKPEAPIDSLMYPDALDHYLGNSGDPRLMKFNEEIKKLFEIAVSREKDDLINFYRGGSIKNLWGTPCHYFCFSKGLDADPATMSSL